MAGNKLQTILVMLTNCILRRVLRRKNYLRCQNQLIKLCSTQLVCLRKVSLLILLTEFILTQLIQLILNML